MSSFRISFILFFIFVPFVIFSQVNIGIKAGANYNFNGLSSDSINLSFNNAVSFSGGAILRIKVKKISLQTEGLFISRKGSISNGALDRKVNFYSFDWPIIIGYKLVDLKLFQIRLNAGVIPSYHIKSFGELEGVNFKNSFYSAAYGISLDVPLFIIDLRFQNSIGDYYVIQDLNSTSTLSNNLFTLSVAWKIL